MSRVRANSLTDKAGYGAPSFPYGAVSAGVITAIFASEVDIIAVNPYIASMG